MGGQELHNVNGSIAGGTVGVVYDFSGATLSNNAYCFGVQGISVTSKSIYVGLDQGSSDQLIGRLLQNTHATGLSKYIAMCGSTGKASFTVSNTVTTYATGINTSGNWFVGKDEFATDDLLRGDKTTRSVSFIKPPKLPSYTVATVPSAATFAQCMIYVSDGTANKRMAISEGTNWRWPDGAIVS